MQHSEQFMQVAAALGRAQAQFPTIPRDKKVTVKTKPKGDKPGYEYSFFYAPLETILEKTRPGLAAAELALVQAVMVVEDGKGHDVEVLRTTLVHSSGEWFANDVPMFVGEGDNKAQAFASGSTYARRLGITLALCVAADEDDDGNGGDQDGKRPDYVRNAQEPYRGSFPKNEGPRRRSDAPAADDIDAALRETASQAPDAGQGPLPDKVVDYGGDGTEAGLGAFASDADGVVTSPYSSELTAGQVSLLKAAALAAKLDDTGVMALVGPIDKANYKTAQAALKAAASQAIGG